MRKKREKEKRKIRKKILCLLKWHILVLLIIFSLFINMKDMDCASTIEKDDRPISVMIGNSPVEREVQKGLSQADIVYEVIVEFPFTRFMAIFLNDKESIVGPVRSSRYYFSRLCAEWSAIFVHCGGQNMKFSHVLDIDEINHASPFWRDEKIGGWINLFTSIAKLREEAKKHGHHLNEMQNQHPLLNSGEQGIWQGNQIHKITIKYHKDYIISYEYHPEKQVYYRYINQKPHIDHGSLEQIKVANILIQNTPVEDIAGDEKGRVQVELIGEGIGRLFREGTFQPLKWLKKTKDVQTSYLDRNGDTVTYHQGMTWIHILSPMTEIWCK